MSLVHMLFERQSDDEVQADYLVMSIDFNPDREWSPIGKLSIRKLDGRFEFQALNEWAVQGITVMQDDDLLEGGRSREGEFSVAWRGRIRTWALRLIEQGRFPATFPD